MPLKQLTKCGTMNGITAVFADDFMPQHYCVEAVNILKNSRELKHAQTGATHPVQNLQ